MTSKFYLIDNDRPSGLKVYIDQGEWKGVTLLFDNFNRNGDSGTYTYEFVGLPSNLVHLLHRELTDEEETSILEVIREIAANLFRVIENVK